MKKPHSSIGRSGSTTTARTTGCPGSATLNADLDLVDALDLDATVTDLADQLGRLGDESPLDSAAPAPSACSPTPNEPSTSTPTRPSPPSPKRPATA